MRLLVAARHGLDAVRVTGEVDAASIDVIENVLLEILERAPDRVELDLSGVSFVDDGGQQIIARAGDYARQRGVALLIIRTYGQRFSAPRGADD